MSKQFEKMVTLLKELFQLDQPDLDFGLYRVMHAKSGEITQFLEQDLLPQVKVAFGQYTTADKAELEKELNKAVEQANGLGVDPETTAKVKELRQKIADESVDVNALENEVYDYLSSFFRRYYHEGDFLSKRVYKPGVYAIPYEGEEVKFHWANSDQYYIKTNEYLRDYALTLRPGDAADLMRVHFHLADAAEGEHGNVKADEGKARVFILANEDFITEEAGELVIRFHYRLATMNDWSEEALAGATAAAKKKPPVQKELLSDAVRRIFAADGQDFKRWLDELSTAHVKANGQVADYSRLQGHLDRYFKRNTFDYFIHKDLGGFLRRELDFYIKNEVMHLDDVESESVPRVEQYLSKIKVIRKIAHKLIDFLAQLEDFQKKLWLKKKFVIETNYCITLDRIPEGLYPEIAANDVQCEEWVQLFAIDEMVDDDDQDKVPYSVPLSAEFLTQNQNLVVDTVHFNQEFKVRILSSLDDVEAQIDGLLLHSDNFQALNLIEKSHRKKIKCAYIDPPYNTESSAILYKNNYKHSSWCTMMRDRISVASSLLQDDGAMFVSIDKTERSVLEHALDDVFGEDNHIEELIWTQATANSQLPNYSTNHEYVQVYAKDRAAVERDADMFREPKPGYSEIMGLVERIHSDYPSAEVVQSEIKKLFEEHVATYKEELAESGREWDAETKRQDPWRGIYLYCRAEYRDEDGKLVEESQAKERNALIRIWREISPAAPASKQSPTTKDESHFNYRYYKPIHPTTGVPCPHPRSGWKFPYNSDPSKPDRKSFVGLCGDDRIAWGGDESKVPQTKGFLHEVETNIGTSVFYEYNDGEAELAGLFGESGLFLSPKSSKFVRRFISQTAKADDWFIDFFGGSGSSGHALIAQNREDGGKRKQILVEVGNHFDSILLPRLKKVSYSSSWKNGKPTARSGGNQILKYCRLESYEDAINNLVVERSATQQGLLELPISGQSDGLKEQYMLRYMLEVEARGSQSLLNVDAFNDPTAYKLKVKYNGGDETRDVNVDLLETFNYLIGLAVQSIGAPQTFQAAFKRDDEGRLRLEGRLRQDETGPWWFRAVYGTSPEGRRTLIVWRKLTGDAEQDNLVLDEWFTRQGYSTRDYEFDMIYVNGDCNLENLRALDETWKVRLIEEDFHRLMFDMTGL